MAQANEARTMQTFKEVMDQAAIIKLALAKLEVIYQDKIRGNISVSAIADPSAFAAALKIGDLSLIEAFLDDAHDQSTNRFGDKISSLV